MYALHSAQELERQLQAGLPLSPIREVSATLALVLLLKLTYRKEKTFNVNGVILNMEFLHPPAQESDHVIVVLFIVESVVYLGSCCGLWSADAGIVRNRSFDYSSTNGGRQNRCKLQLNTDNMGLGYLKVGSIKLR